MCRWSHFQELLEWGRTLSDFLGYVCSSYFTVSKRTSMFVLQMKMKSKVISMGQFIKIESN